MILLGEKLGDGHADQSPDVLRIVSGGFFLGSSRVRPTLLGWRVRLPQMGTVHEKCMCGVRGPAPEAHMSWVSDFPLRVYIDSNRHDSRI
jgi:hypothetical protein